MEFSVGKPVIGYGKGSGWGLTLSLFVTGFSIGAVLQQLLWLERNFISTPRNSNPGINTFFDKWEAVPDCNFVGISYFPTPATPLPNYSIQKNGLDSQVTRLQNSSRVLCLVHILEANFERAWSIQSTWGKRCDKIIFFGDEPEPRHAARDFCAVGLGGFKFLKFRKKVKSNWVGKVFNMELETSWDIDENIWRFVNKRYLLSFEWFLKVDDDSYVLVENLKHHLKNFDPSIPLYGGHTFNREDVICANNKPGYFLSQQGVRRFVLNMDECGDSDNKKTTWEKIFEPPNKRLFSCIRESGINVISDRDYLNRHRFVPDQIESSIVRPANQTPGTISGFNCCSDLAVAFLVKSPEEMYTMDYSIYHLRAFGIDRVSYIRSGR